MKAVRCVLVFVAALLSLFLIGQHFGLSTAACNAYCDIIRSWPLSKLISIAALGGTLALGHALLADLDRRFLLLSVLGAGIAVGLQVIAIVMEGVCPGCMALAFVIVGLAITNVKPAFIGWVGTLFAGFGLYVLYDSTPMAHPRQPTTYLVQRPYEEVKDGSWTAFVIFADPECPACRDLAATESKLDPQRHPVFYRWKLLPSSASRTIRAALCIEGVSDVDWEKGQEFRSRLFSTNQNLTDEMILEVAKSIGVKSRVSDLLASPPADLLKRIAADGKLAERARVHEVPKVLVVAPDTMRLSSGSVELFKRTASQSTLPGKEGENK